MTGSVTRVLYILMHFSGWLCTCQMARVSSVKSQVFRGKY